MNSLIAVTKWIETSSSEDFLANFKSLRDDYSGVTLDEYLEEYGMNDDECEVKQSLNIKDCSDCPERNNCGF